MALASKPVTDDALDGALTAAWKAVVSMPVPPDNVDASGLSGIPAMALVEALRTKVANAPAGVARGQMLNALNTFLRISQPWISFEGR